MKNNFRFAGRESELTCLTCAHWRLSSTRIKGVAPCAIAVPPFTVGHYSGPYATCADFKQAHPVAVTKRKEQLA